MHVMVSNVPVDRMYRDPVAIPVFADQLPLRRAAGRIDWRLGGLLTRLIIEDIISPGRPFLLERESAKSFPAVMVFPSGARKAMSMTGIKAWIEWASGTMARAGARFFNIAVWDLYDNEGLISDFALNTLEGLHVGAETETKLRGIRIIWEPGKAEDFAHELRKARHGRKGLENWDISVGETSPEAGTGKSA